MGFTRTFEKNGEKIGENWSEIEFTSFVENAITTIFDNGGDSLRFSKKMVKKTAKIGQKMNSVSYLSGCHLGCTPLHYGLIPAMERGQ